MFTEMIVKRTKKLSLNGFCCGAVSGLVVITPAAGFVSPAYSTVFGFLGNNLLYINLKKYLLFVIITSFFFKHSWNRLLFFLLFKEDNQLQV